MVIDTALGAPLNLGVGKYICPPTGWAQEGFITGDNPYWLLPKSRLRWVPPGEDRPALHWHLSPTPLPGEIMSNLLELVRGPEGEVSKARLDPLYPGLIRMPLDSITSAEIVNYPRSGRMLCVEYAIPQYGEVGIVHYAPTEMYEFGEYQMLAYEGKEPSYGEYLQIARAAMETFATGQSDLETDEDARKPTRLTEELESLLPWNIDEEPGGAESLDFTPEQGRQSAPPAEEPEPEPVAEAPPEAPPAKQAEPAPVAEAPPAPEPAAEAGGIAGAVEHILQAGETIRSIVQKRWPDLDTDGVMKKVRDIYAFNLERGNKLEAFGLKPGTKVMLPEE